MNKLPDVTIRLFGREYDLAYGRGTLGDSWLLLVNRQTGSVLPVTAVERQATPDGKLDVYDVDGIMSALEAAGIIRPEGVSQPSLGLKVCRCRIVHEGLAKRLASMQKECPREQPGEAGRSR